MMWEINSLSKEIPYNSTQTIAGFKRSGKVRGKCSFHCGQGMSREARKFLSKSPYKPCIGRLVILGLLALVCVR